MADTMATAKNKAQEMGNSAAQAATNMGNTAADAVRNAAGTAADSARNAAGYVADQAKEMASSAQKGVAAAGTYLDDKACDATHAIGGGLRAAGDAIRQNVPQDGRLGQASSAVARGLSDTGDYIEREGLQGIGNDIAGLIKRNPIPALLLGIGLGFLVARAASSSRA